MSGMPKAETLVQRLRGIYAVGKGDPPEFGFRQFANLPAIQREAADRITELEAENAALRNDNRKLALHTAEQATELGKLRDQLEAAQDKALRFDIDSIGIERREAEGAELVTLRAELSAAQARISAYTGTIQRLWGRLNPDLEYVEGATVAYGADEIDRLNARIAELEAALQQAVKQNSHDMVLTGDELRVCEAALKGKP